MFDDQIESAVLTESTESTELTEIEDTVDALNMNQMNQMAILEQLYESRKTEIELNAGSRFKDIMPRTLKHASIAVIGVGGIGSWVVQQLVKIGCTNIAVIDDDIVEAHNIGPQGYDWVHLGMPKVEALNENSFRSKGTRLFTYKTRINSYAHLIEVLNEVPDILITAVDNMEIRNKFAYELLGVLDYYVEARALQVMGDAVVRSLSPINRKINMPKWYFDSRMSLGNWSLFTFPLRHIYTTFFNSNDHYYRTLIRDSIIRYMSYNIFPQDEGIQEPCTARAINFTGAALASKILSSILYFSNNNFSNLPQEKLEAFFKNDRKIIPHTVEHYFNSLEFEDNSLRNCIQSGVLKVKSKAANDTEILRNLLHLAVTKPEIFYTIKYRDDGKTSEYLQYISNLFNSPSSPEEVNEGIISLMDDSAYLYTGLSSVYNTIMSYGELGDYLHNVIKYPYINELENKDDIEEYKKYFDIVGIDTHRYPAYNKVPDIYVEYIPNMVSLSKIKEAHTNNQHNAHDLFSEWVRTELCISPLTDNGGDCLNFVSIVDKLYTILISGGRYVSVYSEAIGIGETDCYINLVNPLITTNGMFTNMGSLNLITLKRCALPKTSHEATERYMYLVYLRGTVLNVVKTGNSDGGPDIPKSFNIPIYDL